MANGQLNTPLAMKRKWWLASILAFIALVACAVGLVARPAPGLPFLRKAPLIEYSQHVVNLSVSPRGVIHTRERTAQHYHLDRSVSETAKVARKQAFAAGWRETVAFDPGGQFFDFEGPASEGLQLIDDGRGGTDIYLSTEPRPLDRIKIWIWNLSHRS